MEITDLSLLSILFQIIDQQEVVLPKSHKIRLQ